MTRGAVNKRCPSCGQKVKRPGNRLLALFGIYPNPEITQEWLLRQQYVDEKITLEQFEERI